MAMCSYVEKRRQRYYFRARLPGEMAGMLGRTHVVGSLLTGDSRIAKIRASRFYFVLAGFLSMLSLRMRDNAHSSEMLDARAAALAQKAFELGCRYEAEQERLRQRHDAEREQLRRHCEAELQAMIKNMQREWQGGAPMPEVLLLERPAAFQAEAQSDMAPAPPVTMTPPSVVSCSPAWHTLRAAFLADKPGLTAKTLWSYNQAFEIWKKLIGDKAIAEIRRADVKMFADHLRDRPNARGGHLNYQSIERSLGHLKIFMAWAVEAGHVADDRFGDVKGRDKTREERMASDSRRAFSAAELTQLFSSPLFTQPAAGDDERAAAWFLLIAALTGARTEEIATAPAELVRVGEVWCLDLRQAGTKTRAAPRLVPLLPELIRLGLLDWAARQAALGRSLVQPGQAKTAAAWSKYLNRYINKHVGDAPDLVLYSLRHGFRQMLRAAGIHEELANKVFGHETGTVGAGYGRQLSALEAKAFVDVVRSPIDLRHVWVG
ncbi:site-specific integrase [Acidocella sp.]|uniref:site-specific integrase n=1 Tax=Acidocella sp. TaxID=50710 RepID=UPI002614B0A3|nr:site-specific integrase [Acidocella sp.]